MMKKQILWLATATVALSSCGIYSKYKPATEVPEGIYGDVTGVTHTGGSLNAPRSILSYDTLSFGNLSWRDVFTDPCLQTLIDTALVRNTDLLTARLRIEEAEASLLTSKLSYLPSLALAPEGSISSFDGSKATKTYSLPVTASWEIDLFGRLTNAKRSAKAALLQSHEYRQAVQTQLIASVANLYYTLLMLDAQYEIATSTEQTWKESVVATRALKSAGMVNEAGLAQTEATYYTVCTTVLDLAEQVNQATNSLSLLLAEVPHDIERGKLTVTAGISGSIASGVHSKSGEVSGSASGSSLSLPGLPETFSLGIPLQMLSNRPDVRSAELSLAQAFYGTNSARSAFYPSITLGGSAGWTNSAGSMIVNPGKLLASVFGSLTQPLFNKGTNIARLKIAKAQQEEARLAFQQALLTAGSEVNDALTQVQTARSKAGYYTQQVASLENAVRSTSLLMQHGNTTYLEVLTAQQTLLSAQLSQVANRFTEIQGVVTLYQALGGGRM